MGTKYWIAERWGRDDDTWGPWSLVRAYLTKSAARGRMTREAKKFGPDWGFNIHEQDYIQAEANGLRCEVQVTTNPTLFSAS